MEPDELLVSTRSAGPDDPDCHPAVAAATASSGARRYLAAGSVLYPGRSNRPPLLSTERIPAEVAAPYRDGLLSDGRGGLHLGIGRIFFLEECRTALPVAECSAASSDHHAVWPACLFGHRVLRVHGQRSGDRRDQFALPASQLEVRDIARLRLAGNELSDPPRQLPGGGLLEPVLRVHDCRSQFSASFGASQHGQIGHRDRLYDLGAVPAAAPVDCDAPRVCRNCIAHLEYAKVADFDRHDSGDAGGANFEQQMARAARRTDWPSQPAAVCGPAYPCN